MDSFIAYIQRLELVFFFSGYTLIYAIVMLITRDAGKDGRRNRFKERLRYVLPYGYALSGTLYLGYLLINIYPDLSPHAITMSVQLPVLVSWALLSLLFWFPVFAKIKVLGLLHSLVFFSLILKDIYLRLFAYAGSDMLKNIMKVHTSSLLFHSALLVAVLMLSYIFLPGKKTAHPL